MCYIPYPPPPLMVLEDTEEPCGYKTLHTYYMVLSVEKVANPWAK